MKRAIAAIAITLALAGSALAQDKPQTDTDTAIIQRAVAAVPKLHSMMRDPDSFILEEVFTTTTPVVLCETWSCRHKSKVPVTSVCFTFRSHNAYGGYGDSGVAVLRSSGHISVLRSDNGYHEKMVDDGAKISLTQLSDPQAPCESKNITASLTDKVKAALNPPAATSPTPTPAEQAEQAQQRADCLKLAVKNPTINCKQPAKGNE